MGLPGSPTVYHDRNHSGPYEDCGRCSLGRAKCKRKRVFGSGDEAAAAALRINVADGFAQPLVSYHCRYCGLFHHATARTKVHVKRAERTRRKWLVADYAGGQP